MPLSLQNAQTLAVGPFNPHIIVPDWLLNNKVCEDGEVEVRLLPLSQGMAFNFGDVQWQVDFRHLFVSSRKADCGALVAKVLSLLIHTPVRAVGNNFHYACSSKEWGNSPLPMLGPNAPDLTAVVGQIEQTRWSCVFRAKDETRVEVTVAREEQDVVVLFNFHRETKDAAAAATAAGQFAEDSRQSRDLIRRLFGQEVSS
jgi:hypothetical protein